MAGTVRRIWLLAAAGTLLGALFVALGAQSFAVTELQRAFEHGLDRAFPSGLWRMLAYAALAFTAAALACVLVDALLSMRGGRRRTSFEPLGAGNVREAIIEIRRRLEACLAGPHPDIIQAFDELVRGAVKVAASDIHMSPQARGFALTYRVHGTLHEVLVAEDLAMMSRFVTRVKVLARLDTYVRTTPQDGRLVMSLDGHSIEARVSTLPTELGERVVLRLVRGGRAVPELEALGFSPAVVANLRSLLSRPQGLIFVTGAVGSGKSTTLYAALQHISQSRGRMTSLVTLEDPVELELSFATQTQINTRTGMTFANALRSVLRQDPNVLMVGEIRDKETAEIAMQASLTGHLILTTVHGESAAAPFPRLMDMKIEPFILASATIGSLSQRLVRTLCVACRKPAEPEPLHLDQLARHNIELPSGTFFAPVGCEFCEGQGFTGRAPICELLVMNDALRQAVNQARPLAEIHRIALEQGMIPLLRDGIAKAAAGETSLTEVLRVVG